MPIYADAITFFAMQCIFLMSIFSLLLLKIIPLYFSVAIGFASGRLLHVDRDSISRLVVYVIVPIVFFRGGMNTAMSWDIASLLVVVFLLCVGLCLAFYAIGRRIWSDATANVLGLAAGQGNMGYFGLPVAMLLFDAQTVGIYMVMIIAMIVQESTLGFYITARGKHTPMDAIKKLLKIPTLYAYSAGLIGNQLGWQIPAFLAGFFDHVFGAYTLLGMMIVGLGLASVRGFAIDLRFVSLAFLAKFICWPALALLVVNIDTHWLGLYSEQTHHALILVSIVPLAANSVAIASILDAHPEKAATAVFLSTLIALFYVPLMVMWFIAPV